MVNLKTAFKGKPVPKTKQGAAGYDNARENIDPHVKTKAISTKEVDCTAFKLRTSPTVNHVLTSDAAGVASWQVAPAGGDVEADANLTDETIVQGDGGAKKIKTSTATVAQIAANVTHTALTTGNPHVVLLDELGNPSGNAAFTMANKQIKFTFQAPATADGGFEIEATGGFSGDLVHIHQHTGNPGAVDLVHLEAVDSDVVPLRIVGAGTYDIIAGAVSFGNIVTSGTVDGIDIATDVAANTTHRGDNTQAHSDYLKNDAADVGVALTLTADHDSNDTQFTAQVIHGTDGAPPAASGFPRGTIYIQYTA